MRYADIPAFNIIWRKIRNLVTVFDYYRGVIILRLANAFVQTVAFISFPTQHRERDRTARGYGRHSAITTGDRMLPRPGGENAVSTERAYENGLRRVPAAWRGVRCHRGLPFTRLRDVWVEKNQTTAREKQTTDDEKQTNDGRTK